MNNNKPGIEIQKHMTGNWARRIEQRAHELLYIDEKINSLAMISWRKMPGKNKRAYENHRLVMLTATAYHNSAEDDGLILKFG